MPDGIRGLGLLRYYLLVIYGPCVAHGTIFIQRVWGETQQCCLSRALCMRPPDRQGVDNPTSLTIASGTQERQFTLAIWGIRRMSEFNRKCTSVYAHNWMMRTVL
jgi:hypothetical protein